MNNIQENKLYMYYAVQRVCQQNSASWRKIKAFADFINEFEDNILKIAGRIRKQGEEGIGFSAMKKDLENEMTELTLQVADALSGYATDTRDPELKNRMMVTRDELRKLRDTDCLQRCQAIKDTALQLGVALEDYGIGTGDISRLQEHIDAFVYAIVFPRSALRTGAADELGSLFYYTDMLLNEKLDTLMDHFIESGQDFYNDYFNARKVTHHTLQGEVLQVGEQRME